jgi:ribosome-associated protein
VAEGRWGLLDYNDVVVHIFLEPVRVFYDLEGLWTEAPTVPVRERARGSGPREETKTGGRA